MIIVLVLLSIVLVGCAPKETAEEISAVDDTGGDITADTTTDTESLCGNGRCEISGYYNELERCPEDCAGIGQNPQMMCEGDLCQLIPRI